jgi:hypothetical protein
LSKVLVGQVEVSLHFVAVSWSLSSLALSTSWGISGTLREFCWPLACCSRNNHVIKVFSSLWQLSIIKGLFFKWVTMSILLRLILKRSHLIQSVLNCIILLSRHIGRLSTCCTSRNALSICEFEIKINTLSKLVNIDCIFGTLINVGSCCYKSIITGAWAKCATGSSPEVTKLSVAYSSSSTA